MENQHCPICKGHDLEIKLLGRRPSYYSCRSCGHNFIKSDKEKHEDSFLEAQNHYYGGESILLDDRLSIFENEIMKERFRVFGKFLPKGADVLEVGPGAGHVLKWLSRRGHQVTGVEHSQTLAQQLTDRHQLPIINAEFETYDFGESSFDTFCSFHVIEHVLDPLAHLIKAFEVVKPGGLAFIATPNADSWEQRAAPKLGPNFDAAHLHIFSPQSLQMACEQAGWQIVYQSTPESAGGWARVFSGLLRAIRQEDATETAGKYARSSSTAVRIIASIFQFVTIPSRLLQRRLGAGNEIFTVLQKPHNHV
ncbi:Probable S-adenosylmethionine-dependent methyltransferase MSMEG_2350 [Pannonibacter phragmitetus]|uniref:Probable S-adenosylmethionine-dependent methyltransferase MSMEG_2350 n=1 Tax=Pannonibacter phragmitetus TaxID=121719 RepID=A0A378ZPF3_9HYPH|nr:class I SAM-dependent methyltransferase [Pannonibacter phragmitetus]SUA99136.1 Probable S-adenosylmethionine-dependent methyltransferase MSMEG_2350 [Pannonibacter phragmitetus]